MVSTTFSLRWLWRAARVPVTGAAILAGQVLHAAHRHDMPGLLDQNSSGVFGNGQAPLLRIVLVGDSSLTSPGVDPPDAAWPQVLARRLTDRYTVELISFASGGSKADDVLADQVPRALEVASHLALVSVGANDALRATPLRRYEETMNEILARLAAHNHGVGVSGIGDLGTVPRLPTLARGIGRIRGRAFDRAVARVAARYSNVVKSVTWGPQWRLFEEGDPAHVFAADRFHVAAAGQVVFAAAFQPVVDALLGMLPSSEATRDTGT